MESSDRQAQEIMELSVPIIQVWEGIIAAPLIGTMDSNRTSLFMERLLSKIVETKAPICLIDITGVPAVETQTAQHLMEAVTSAKLLGTKVIVTGISPSVAQTIVQLGIDFRDIETCSTLYAGVQIGLQFLEHPRQ
jgi:rsbT co-antagonist protein RsbR